MSDNEKHKPEEKEKNKERKKTDENKFEELKFFIQIWQHHDTMFWNRFTTFIAAASILITFLGAVVLFGISNQNLRNENLLSTRISAIIVLMAGAFVVITIFWYFMLNHIFIWVDFYLKKARASQKELGMKILFNNSEGPIFPFLAKIPSIRIMDFLFSFFCICGILVVIQHFLMVHFSSWSIDNPAIFIGIIVITPIGTLVSQHLLNQWRSNKIKAFEF
ncbi:MAG: hypothetical protein ACFFB5_20720 [Promethearchaeota archaeon]